MSTASSLAFDQALTLLRLHSPPLAQALTASAQLQASLFEQGGLDQPTGEEELSALLARPPGEGEEEAALFRRLRRAKTAVFTRLAIRDLAGLADLAEVVETLSLLADLTIAEALQAGVESLLQAKGLGSWPADEPLPFCVIGLGKLGGWELNYSSDVDLLYLHQPGKWPFGEKLAAAEFAAGLGAFISRALSQVTPDGLVFRVDLNLRPAGKDGPLAPSLEAAKYHYQYQAADWERLALIKARPIAGNLRLGQEFIEETLPFVFRRYLDYLALEDLKGLKARIASRPRSLTQSGQDLKLDRGGIRQIEFFVQTLQLIYGGRNPAVRTANTLQALRLLHEHQIISEEDRLELSAAYTFLRRAEHRIQLFALAQTQTLPSGREALDRLGRAMGSGDPAPGRFFMEDLAHHTDHAASRFEALLAGPPPRQDSRPLAGLLRAIDSGDEDEALDLVATMSFQDPQRALDLIRNLKADSFLPQSMHQQRQLLAQVLPAMLDRVLEAYDPDTALIRLERFLARIGPKTGLYILLLENPHVLDLLVRLMSTSAFLARVLTAHSGLLDSLIDHRSLAAKGPDELKKELGELLGAATDVEEKAGLIRRFKADETVRIAVQDLTEELPLERVSDQLSDLAETVLGETVLLATEILSSRYRPAGPADQWAFTILGLGKLGGRELAYYSDLDVVFLFQAAPAQPAGQGELGPAEYAVKLAQRIISLLSIAMPEGPGYEIDPRLRPSGRQGPLVISLDSFSRYHQSSAVWERLALLKLRPVAGDEGLGRQAVESASQAVFTRELPPDWAAQLQELRKKMLQERGAKTGFDIKMGAGGLADVEFAAQALQLYYGRQDPSVRTPYTLKGLTALYENGCLKKKAYEALFEGYRFIRNLDHRLRLLYDRSGDTAYTEDEILKAGVQPADLKRICRRVGKAYEKVMEDL